MEVIHLAKNVKKIKIDDLTNPILSEFQKAAKDYGETQK